MKVEGPSKAQQAGKTEKAKKAGKADGTFGDMVTGASRGIMGTAASQSIASVDTLLAVQGAESATEKAARCRMQERGDKLLNQLDSIRMGLLTGTLTIGQVIDIADVVASHREKITDSKLTAILDELDLRAQIEIAKMRKAMEARL